MLKTDLIHPQLLKTISAAGHGAEILITDGNYPVSTKTKSDVEKIYLNLAPGLVNVPQVLNVLTKTINIEAVTVMEPKQEKDEKDKEIFTDKKKPTNLLIEGDNYHALQVLNYTHQGKVDVIYIDPPYNTGKEKNTKIIVIMKAFLLIILSERLL